MPCVVAAVLGSEDNPQARVLGLSNKHLYLLSPPVDPGEKNDLISKKSKCGKHLRVFPGYVGPEVGIFLTTQIPPPQVMADAPIIIKLYYNVRCLKYQKAHDCALSFRLQ